MTTRAEIIVEARTWIGTRWHHQASRKGVGCDCIGLVAAVARELGIDGAAEYDAALEVRGYGRSPDPKMLIEAADRFLRRIADDTARPGDILVMRFTEDPQHFALVVSVYPWRIVHAYAQARRVVEHQLDNVWRARVMRAYSYRGIA
jgi:NlpC/P60 family putative phage cell wall peptidase